MQRYWLLADRILTSQDLKRAGISPLRAVSLGRCATVEAALAKGRARFGQEPAIVAAHNVRIACDRQQGALWGLTAEQISRLRAGETLTLEDALGRFAIAYSRLED